MRLARQQRSCAKEISLINVVEDLAVDALCRLRNFNAALPYQIERIARFAFAKNYFTRFLSQHAKFWRDALDDVGINSFEKPIVVESFDGSGPRGRFHSIKINSRSMSRPAGSYRFERTSRYPERFGYGRQSHQARVVFAEIPRCPPSSIGQVDLVE